jgi:hypothetical protein
MSLGEVSSVRVGQGREALGLGHPIARRDVSILRRAMSTCAGRLTRNSKSFAVGVITVISWAVAALCNALGPGDAKDTLPTRTFWHTVRD